MIKQRVHVEAGGRVALQSPELHEGDSAEIIVIVDQPSDSARLEKLDALNRLRRALNLDPATAARWESDTAAERMSRPRLPIRP